MQGGVQALVATVPEHMHKDLAQLEAESGIRAVTEDKEGESSKRHGSAKVAKRWRAMIDPLVLPLVIDPHLVQEQHL